MTKATTTTATGTITVIQTVSTIESLPDDAKGILVGSMGYRDANLHEFAFIGSHVYNAMCTATVGRTSVAVFYDSTAGGLSVIGTEGDDVIVRDWAFITGFDGHVRSLTEAERRTVRAHMKRVVSREGGRTYGEVHIEGAEGIEPVSLTEAGWTTVNAEVI